MNCQLSIVNCQLFLVSQHSVAVFASAYRPAVDNVAEEYAAVTNLAGVGCFEEYIYGVVYANFAADNGNCHTLNHIGVVNHATVYPFLTRLTDSVYIVILKPVDV